MTHYIFTSAAANYAPKVALLYESVKRFHPECPFVLLSVERTRNATGRRERLCDEEIALDDLPVGRDRGWLFQHNIVELSTAVKPAALLSLLDRPGCTGVTYIDPDIVLFDRIDQVLRFEGPEAVILTPHLCRAETTPVGVMDHEISCLRHGLYNLGFLSVRNSPDGRRAAQWWHDRVRAHCDADTTTGLFTDQKWMDFLPIFFDGVRVEKSPQFNVAPWNIAQRPLTRDGDHWLVQGRKLGFYHFTGFDSGAHGNVLGAYAKDSPAVHDLVSWYSAAEARLKQEFSPLPTWSCGSFDDGEPILPRHRLVYRRRSDVQQAFPDPFVGSYQAWFRRHGRKAGALPGERPGLLLRARGWIGRRLRRLLS